ncbi:MAG: beta-carotene hydroxylase [bacterium]
MNWYWIALLIFVTFIFMDFVAWFTHKYVMHGFLWILHKDHHTRENKIFEWNDLFALMFAIPAVILMITGSISGIDIKFYIGAGIALYGLAYFIFHDLIIHQRIRFFRNANNFYLRSIISAHENHHRGRKNYGFLIFFQWKYFNPENHKAFYSRKYANH